jgi:lipid-binding SYLF domain-containing protein
VGGVKSGSVEPCEILAGLIGWIFWLTPLQNRFYSSFCVGFETMRLYPLFALLFMMTPTAGNAELSLDGLKERASKAAKAVGETAGDAVDTAGEVAGKATDAAKETVESTKKDMKDEATPEATRAKLDAMADKTLSQLFAEQPASRELFDRSAGYAVFDTREASFYVVAGYGRGVAVDRRNDSRTYMKMATAGAGMSFGVGGFDSQQVILFEDGAELAQFIDTGMDASAQVGTMTGEKQDQLALRFNEAKAVFVLTKKGWKIAAKLTGSRYWPDDELN